MSEEMKQDIAILKQDVGTLRTDVSTLKQDVGTLRTDVSTLKTDMSSVRVAVSRVVGEMHDLKVSMRQDMSKGFERVLSKLESFAGEVDSSRRHRTLQDKDIRSIHDQLVDHEVRLARMERPEKKS